MPEILTALAAVLVGAATMMKTMAEVRKLRTEVSLTQAQLLPNGGRSARDAINRTESTTADMAAQVAATAQLVAEVSRGLQEVRHEIGRLGETDLADRRAADDVHRLMMDRLSNVERKAKPWRR